ncbi:cis-golgi transport protein particle complex subunit [Xylariales sp. PMI_506]|nr:cis-golgi transport protein particle complex subunit [Xylariales sp. PMI_506]
MAILALIIINKAGGLIYNRTFAEGLNQLNTNDYLVLAGTFHGVHAITTRLSPLRGLHQPATAAGNRPEPPSGLEVLESENFRLQCFNTMTGIKFLLFTDQAGVGGGVATGGGFETGGPMRRVYELYADYVMKNPFYQLEMPVRCETFDRKLNSYIREINNAR